MSARPTSQRGRQRGFTLLELMIGISLLGLMLVILFAGLRLGSRSWDSIELHSARNTEMRLVRNFIRRGLRQAQGPQIKDEDGQRLVFGGAETAIEFVTPLGGYLGLGGAYLVRLELQRTDKGEQLVLTRWLYHPEVLEGGEGVPEWEPLVESSGAVRPVADASERVGREVFGQQVLLESVEDLEFAYYGTLSDEEEPSWHDEWDDRRWLPDLVRMQLQETSRWWPDLYVALPATFSPANSRGRFLPGAF